MLLVAQNHETAIFLVKLHLKKICYQIFCVKTVSDKVVRHSLAYLFVYELLLERRLLHKNLANTDPLSFKTPIFNLLLLVVPQP